MSITKLKTISITAAVFVFLGFALSYWITKRDQKRDAASQPTLSSNEKKKVLIDSSKRRVLITEKKEDGSQKTKVVEGVEKTIVTLTNDGSLEVMTVNNGFTFKPGIGVGVANEGRIYLDVQVYWWRQYSILFGTSYGPDDGIRGHGGLGYALPFDQFRNTVFFLAVDNKSDLNVGVSVRF